MTIEQALQRQSFLAGMPGEYLRLIADCSDEQLFSRDDYLIRFQQSADVFYFLLEGQVTLLDRVPGKKPYELETLNSPTVLGWSWLMPPYRWHFDVKANSEVKSIRVHAPCLRGKMVTDTAFGCDMYKRFIVVLAERLQATRLQGMDIYAPPEGQVL